MKEIFLLLAPQWWSIKNRIVGLDQTLYFRSLFLLLFGGGFWAGSIYLLNLALSRLQGLSGEAGAILTLKGLSLFILVSFFILVFSGLITAISRFYLSQELTMLLSFPISRGKIFAAKWFETLLSSSWMVLLFGIPLFFSFGLQFHVSWWYYPWFLVCFILFIPIPVSMGICLAILLMSVLPARRGKNLFMFIGFLIFGLVYLLFRFMRPERMINPEWFANMSIFLADMQTPTSIFLPSMWMAETLGPFFGTGEGTPVFYALLLGFTGAAFMVFGFWTYEALFTRGWLKAQEGKKVLFTLSETAFRQGGWISIFGIYRALFSSIRMISRGVRRALFEKDLHLFFRDEGQWSQLPLLITLVIIYLFSIKALPLEWGSLVGQAVKYMVAFLNIGIVGVIMASLSSRFLFPSVSMEGRSFWLIQTSPVTLRTFLWSKFLLNVVPMFLMTLILIGFSTYFLHVKSWMVIISMGTALILSASLTGLSIGMGAIYHNFEAENLSQIQTGFRGAFFMLFAVILIIGTIALEAIPTMGFFLGEVSEGTLVPRAKIMISIFFAAALLLNILFLYIPMRMGEKRLAKL